MKSWYNKNDCEHLGAYHAHYTSLLTPARDRFPFERWPKG